jgi:hypothetical protein
MRSASRYTPQDPKARALLSKAPSPEDLLASKAAELVQLSRTIHLLVSKYGVKQPDGTMAAELDQESISPLWNLEYSKIPDTTAGLKIVASLYPEPTPDQLDQLAAKLLGTKDQINKHSIPLGIKGPDPYLQRLLVTRVVAGENGWSPPKPQPPPEGQPPPDHVV